MLAEQKKIKVLITEDSKLVQEMLKEIISSDGSMEVIGIANNGKEAIEMIPKLKPDIVTMDIDMPIMNGFQAIEFIMANNPLPILVISSHEDAKFAFDAIAKGAMDIYPKGDLDGIKVERLIHKIKTLSKVKIAYQKKVDTQINIPSVSVTQFVGNHFSKVVAIASSTGGPKALTEIFSHLPGNFPYPIVVAQHISDDFMGELVKWLNSNSPLVVMLAKENTKLQAGKIYFSPSEKNLDIDSTGTMHLVERKLDTIYFPSCNYLLESVAKSYGKSVIGVILTGMGDDGATGMLKIKESGGYTIAQDEASCIVYGMPKVAVEKNAISEIVTLKSISKKLIDLAKLR